MIAWFPGCACAKRLPLGEEARQRLFALVRYEDMTNIEMIGINDLGYASFGPTMVLKMACFKCGFKQACHIEGKIF
jgi:hypothetical protein